MPALSDSGKVALITGATGGIGQAIAIQIAKQGTTTVVVGRDKERGEAAVADIKTRSGSRSVELMLADLSSQQEIRTLALDFMARHARLDVLINNVGGLYGKRWETADGLEGTFALNHLGPFLLTHLLLPLLQRSAPARIVNINSEGHKAATTVDFDGLRSARWKRGFDIYAQSKLANLLFTYELAGRLNAEEVTVNAVHPGIVDTQLFRRFVSEKTSAAGFLAKAAAFVVRQVAYRSMKFDSVETAAEGPVYLASSSEVAGITGRYFDSHKKMTTTSPSSYDASLSAHVWKVSAALCGLIEQESEADVASVPGGAVAQRGDRNA
jgi:retinol dehydrogenase-14